MTSLININGETRDSSGLTIPQDRDFRAAWQFSGDVIEIDVEKAKPIAKEKINAYRDEMKHKPFTVVGLGEFSADEISKSNIDGAAQAALLANLASQPFSINWSLHDGSGIILDGTQMTSVAMTLMNHIDVQYTNARTRRATMNAATTFAEIEAVLAELV